MSPKEAAAAVLEAHRSSYNPDDGTYGSTVSLHHGDLRGRDVHSVGVFPDETWRGVAEDLTPERLEAFIEAKRDRLADPRTAIGTWVSREGQLYVEVTALVKDRSQAEALGARYNQEGIFHLGGDGYIDTGGTGAALENLPDDRLKDVPLWPSE